MTNGQEVQKVFLAVSRHFKLIEES
jgi:hypothetical protein